MKRALLAIPALFLLAAERPADACGGCFHGEPTPQTPVTESSIVADHRMVFSISPDQTILWDQIRYNGNPSEFAWVLPVKPGARIELSRDEWVAAIDATTQPLVIQPRTQSFGGGGGSFGEGDYGGGGCGCGDSATASSFSDKASAGNAESDPPPPAVQVVSQEVVGPYEAVVVHSDKPNAVEEWLHDHGYAIPNQITPILEAYQTEGFDFVALRLRPGQGVRAMKPVRIVMPGANPTLPLRMVAAGVGAHVGLTLYVISEGRYRPQNFPEVTIKDSEILWDVANARSNYQEVSANKMAVEDGRAWLTEFAGRTSTYGNIPQTSTPAGTTPQLYDAYYNLCYGRSRSTTPDPPSPFDAGVTDAGDSDAGETDAGDPDADVDAGTSSSFDAGGSSSPTPGLCMYGEDLCCDFDDLVLATNGMHPGDIWLTRLRSDLPVAALSADLRLEAHPEQSGISNIHQASLPGTVSGGATISPKRSNLGTGLFVGLAAVLVGRLLRRRR